MPRVLIEDFGWQIVDVGYGMWDVGLRRGARPKTQSSRKEIRGQTTEDK
jgi:hypothetical protein